MPKAHYDVAVMHDFFVDRILHARSLSHLLDLAGSKAREGGGSVHGVRQEDLRGGNAVNLAHSLSRLGARVLLITHSDHEHMSLLMGAFEGLGAELRVKQMPPGLTVAIEGEVNVMMSESGGAESFPPSLLTAEDWEALRRSRVVCTVNWAANKYGTHLLMGLRKELGPEANLFFNPSDVRDRFEEYAALVRTMKRRRLADWLSLNEYEAASTSRALDLRERSPRQLCARIAEALHARIDVHTEAASYTSHGGGVTERRTARVKPRRLTGAGDVWDAASIFGYLRAMDDGDRLAFANAAARLHIRSERHNPPTFAEVARTLR